MADFVTPDKRSKIMRGVKQKDTRPEITVRKALHAAGFRFRLHARNLPGKPDIVLPKFNTVVFVHGCFWHQHAGCKDGRVPASRVEYWEPKLRRNQERDQEKARELEAAGWNVVTVWECEAKDPATLERAFARIRQGA
jgi:DNA mismatch endonuclease (patch repair protein)